MNAVPKINPIASKHENGRIAVYIASTYQYLPHESALSLFTQLAKALDIPYSEGVAMFAAKMLHAYRNDGDPGDIDGAQAEELALECELLEPFVRGAESCGEGCCCDEGDRCLRLSDIGTALVAMLDADNTVREVRL